MNNTELQARIREALTRSARVCGSAGGRAETPGRIAPGTFVATFVYAVLALGAIGQGGPAFVPHISITVTLALMVADLAVLIYFLHHITTQVQLPQVIALVDVRAVSAGRWPVQPQHVSTNSARLSAAANRARTTVRT